MFDYLQKFAKLPVDVKAKVSSPEALVNIEILEKRYSLSLAPVIMKVMVKDILLNNLVSYFAKEEGLPENKAKELAKELEQMVFKDLRVYLKGELEAPVKRFSSFGPSFPARQSTLPAPEIKANSYFFSSQDEEEIRQLAKKINGMGNDGLNGSALEKAEKIIKEIDINFGSSYLEKRFKEIIATYLRGIRDKIDTKIALRKQFGEGGLGFDEESIDYVFKVIESELKQEEIKPPKQKPRFSVPEDYLAAKANEDKDKLSDLKNLGVRDAGYDLKKALAQREKISPTPASSFKLDTSHELAPLTPVAVKPADKTERKIKEIPQKIISRENTPVKANIQEFGEKRKIYSPGPAPVPESPALPKKPFTFFRKPPPLPAVVKNNIPTGLSGKKIMEDVKVVPKVMDPIDELRYLDLVSFRRLSDDPKQSAEKIVNKINLLEEDQFKKRSEGIKAWRQSMVNKLYLNIGRAGISQNKPISVIIEERKRKGDDYLTEEEFTAIMDLNKGLRF